MPIQGINVAGQFVGLPGSYYTDDVSSLAITPVPTTPPLLLIGYGWGPKPKTATTFTSATDLLTALRGAPVAAFVPFLSAPSPQLNGTQNITFIDASQNTQATAALLTSAATTAVSLTSTLYGPPSNQLAYTVSAGSTAGLKVSLYDGWSGSNLIGDNLTVPLQLAYSGTATGAVSYTMTSGASSGSFAISSPIAGESVTVPVGAGGYATVSDLVQYLNGTSNYFAQVLSATGGQLPSLSLTAMSGALAIPVSGALQYANVNAYLQDVPFWVNQFAAGMASAVVSGSADDTLAGLIVTGSPTFFSGARGVPPVTADYASALNVGLTTPAWTVFCDTNTTAVQALLAAHCEIAGTPPNSAWRRGFTGSSIGDTPTAAQTSSRNLDSYQMAYVYPGIYAINPSTGVNQLYSGLYAAAMAAAMATGNQIAQPLTNKVLNATGVELANAGTALTPSQLVSLQNNGVMAVYMPQQTGVPTILSDMTTWEVDNNAANTSSQQVACRFWLAYSIVIATQPYVGTIASPITEVNIANAVKRTLNALIFTGGTSNGVLASWNNKSLVLVFNGSNQLVSISFQATLVSQNRYIVDTATIVPLSFSIAVS